MPSISVFECAASGRAEEIPLSDGKAASLPPGWVEVSIKTRYENPNHDEILAAIEQIIQGSLQGWPPEARTNRAQVSLLTRQVEAQFAASLAATPEFVEQTATAYFFLGDPAGVQAVQEISSLTGISIPGAESGDSDEGEGTGEDATDKPAPSAAPSKPLT